MLYLYLHHLLMFILIQVSIYITNAYSKQVNKQRNQYIIREMQTNNTRQASQTQPMIKIIPPNPLSNSILIVYCYTNTKAIHCQAKWLRVQESLSNPNMGSTINTQTGNTYKCTPLDCYHSIHVEATCQYMGKTYKLMGKTQPVKPTKQLIERKMVQKELNCKITNSNQQISCKITLNQNKTLPLSYAERTFNLQLHPNHVHVSSPNTFKSRILSNRYQFLAFFHSCTTQKQPSTHNYQLSLTNLFQFVLESEEQRNLVLLKIAQSNAVSHNEKQSNNFVNLMPKFISSHQQLPVNSFNFLQYSKVNNNTGLKVNESKDHHESVEKNIVQDKRIKGQKSFFRSHLRTPDENRSVQSKSPIFFLNHSPKSNQMQRKQSIFQNKKDEKIKISQKLTKKLQKQNNQEIAPKSHNEHKKKNDLLNATQKTVTILNRKQIGSHKNVDKQFLNIFDSDQDNGPILQSSAPEFYGQVNNKSITNFFENNVNLQNQDKDLPSINLRTSFEEMEKIMEQDFNVQLGLKHQTQTCRELGDLHHKNKHIHDFFNTSPSERTQNCSQNSLQKSIDLLRAENELLKQQNLSLKRQLQSLSHHSIEQVNLKNKINELTVRINKLELEKRDLLSEKMRMQSFYHKQRAEREALMSQLGQITKLVQQKDFNTLLKHMKQAQNLSIRTDETHKKMLSMGQCSTSKNVKPRYIPQSRNNTPPSKLTTETQSPLLQQSNGHISSNHQTRRQLRLPSYSFKFKISNKNTPTAK